MRKQDSLRAPRMDGYSAVSTHLALLSDYRLREMVSAASPLGSGIGGRSAELVIEGRRVFVKRIPLTENELHPKSIRSTANLFGLPMFYQYGVGSAGFGAWRELAVHVMTTNWVLGNEYAGFPLMYHWRVLLDFPTEGFTEEFGGLDGAVAHWEGSPAVRKRLEAIESSSSSLVLFLEHVPRTLTGWLADNRKIAMQHGGSNPPDAWVEEALTEGTAFMRSRGLVHFDAHFGNILTDGSQLYFTDFGLALSARFDLSVDESTFLLHHRVYDHCYTVSQLLRHHLLGRVENGSGVEAVLREWIAGRRPDGMPLEIAAMVDRHLHSAVVLESFHRRLYTDSKRTLFPAEKVDMHVRRS